MRIALLLPLPLMLLAGCETTSRPYAPVRDIRYQAIGAEPFWLLAIGDDRIVLNTSQQGIPALDADGDGQWPRTLPRTVHGVRTWQSSNGVTSITIEARPGPCETEGEEIYSDHVVVRIPELELTGCGGRRIRRGGD